MTAFFSRALPVTALGRATSIPGRVTNVADTIKKISRIKTTSMRGDTLMSFVSDPVILWSLDFMN
jgi:hypothetical protein